MAGLLINFLFTIVLLGLGSYMFWQGWVRKGYPSRKPLIIGLPEFLAIGLIRLFKGDLAAANFKNDLLQESKLKRQGFYYYVTGCVLLSGGILEIIILIIASIVVIRSL